MVTHERAELRVPVRREPRGGALAVSQRPEGIVPRQELVDVVQQCGGLDAPAVDRDPALGGSKREPARDLRHRADVPHEPLRGHQ